MEFYNVKTRSKVDVPDSNITKKRMVKTSKNGTKQTRYALIANHDGATMWKFVNEETWNSMDVDEVK